MFKTKEFFALIDSFKLSDCLDVLGIAVVDFNAKIVDQIKYDVKKRQEVKEEIYFDLASVTKVLTNGAMILIKELSEIKSFKLVLEHQSGIPSWGYFQRRTGGN